MRKRQAWVSVVRKVPASQYLLLPAPPPQRPKYSQVLRQASIPPRMSAHIRRNFSLRQTDSRESLRTFPRLNRP